MKGTVDLVGVGTENVNTAKSFTRRANIFNFVKAHEEIKTERTNKERKRVGHSISSTHTQKVSINYVWYQANVLHVGVDLFD